MDFESMVRELIEQGIPASLVGGVIIITNPDTGEQRGLNTNISEDVDIFRNIHAQYVPEDDGSGIVGGVTDFVRDAASGVGGLWATDILQVGGDNEPTNATGQPSPQNQEDGQQLSERDKNRAEGMGWDFDKHGSLPLLKDWKNDPIPGKIDWELVTIILNQIIRAEDRSIVEEERERAAKTRHETREDAQAAADLRNQTDPGWLVTHEPTTDYYYIYKDFKPRFSVDAQGNQIMQTSEGGVWEIVEEEEKYIPKTREEYLLQLVAQGKYDEAAQFDQIMDQFESERMTPERAAEMLVNIAYNPYDFKAMMDAMLGRDSKLDATTVDIADLQAQAARMLEPQQELKELKDFYGPRIPTLQDVGVVPETRTPEELFEEEVAASNAMIQDLGRAEGPYDPYGYMPVVAPPSRLYDRQRAVDRNLLESGVPIAAQGLMPEGTMTPTEEQEFGVLGLPLQEQARRFEERIRRSNAAQFPTILDEELETTGQYQDVAPAFVAPSPNRQLSKEIAQLGHDAFKRVEAAKAKAYEQSKLFGGTDYPGSLSQFYEEGTKGRLKELGKYLGGDATAFERNQRLQQKAKQKLFEAGRPVGVIRR